MRRLFHCLMRQNVWVLLLTILLDTNSPEVSKGHMAICVRLYSHRVHLPVVNLSLYEALAISYLKTASSYIWGKIQVLPNSCIHFAYNLRKQIPDFEPKVATPV